MKGNNIVRQPSWANKRCPYCHKELDKIALIKRNMKKSFVCKKCKAKIDERYIVW